MRIGWIAVTVLVAILTLTHQEKNAVTTKPNEGRMDYIEFPATDIAKTKAFYIQVFGWKFTDYGPAYTSFEDGRIAGGFNKERPPVNGGVLVVIYASDLIACEVKVKAAGGKIAKDAFDFPGGRRFHFTDPSGNELAVWSEK
jgi:predicted enzyme related to lactoylglutathione lyase